VTGNKQHTTAERPIGLLRWAARKLK